MPHRNLSDFIPNRQWAQWSRLWGMQEGIGSPPAIGLFAVDADTFSIVAPNNSTPDYYPVRGGGVPDYYDLSTNPSGALLVTAVNADTFTIDDPSA